MKRLMLAGLLVLAMSGVCRGHGLLIPEDRSVPPLALLSHHVNATIEDQVAVTKVEQTFRNHTSTALEATYVFPVPRNASVRKFSMWVDGKEVKGELVEADKARQLYHSIVRQTRDPGLLEYVGQDLLQLKVYPVPASADLKVALHFTSIAPKDHNLVEYVYPLRSNWKSAQTLEGFSMKVSLKSGEGIANVYSPTHGISLRRENDNAVEVTFQREQMLLNKDFQLYYTTSNKDVGVTAIQHRPIAAEDGYVMLLLSPRAELAKKQQVPRDLVFVLDTSGSMREDDKMTQAKKALKQCIESLSENDRFGLVTFATTVNTYREHLTAVDKSQIEEAGRWVDQVEASGGTAIHAALMRALKFRGDDAGRTFTLVFFTDGQPTIGETSTDKILADLLKENTSNTRIFSFGVGYDLNAAFLDQIANRTRAASTYVRPEDDLSTKVTSFFGKITHPVLANLKLEIGEGVRLVEVYPPTLPDLFHGDQLIVLARYQGSGQKSVVLQGTVGEEMKKIVHETTFKAQATDRPFVEELWARRKVGFLLDQIRLNGEKEELVKEVTALAKKYGITTPYTSFLVMPDAPVPVGGAVGAPDRPDVRFEVPAALAPGQPGRAPQTVAEFARQAQLQAGGLEKNRDQFQDETIRKLEAEGDKLDESRKRLLGALDQKRVYDRAYYNFNQGQFRANQVEKLGVDLAECTNALKCQSQLVSKALRQVAKRNCLEIGGVWIDEGFTAKTPSVTVKAQSDAYFRILERHPEMGEVFQLGNHLVWIAPSGTALVVDANDGKESLKDDEIDKLFIARK